MKPFCRQSNEREKLLLIIFLLGLQEKKVANAKGNFNFYIIAANPC
jgi:hypothetical protein